MSDCGEIDVEVEQGTKFRFCPDMVLRCVFHPPDFLKHLTTTSIAYINIIRHTGNIHMARDCLSLEELKYIARDRMGFSLKKSACIVVI
jgi:hypothetical protein